MNVIAPVFANENAAFASANQDLILRAMQRATPMSVRAFVLPKKGDDSNSDNARVLRSVPVGISFNASDVITATGLDAEQVKVALAIHVKRGNVERLQRGCNGRRALYRRLK